MMHDFVITEQHAVFLDSPIVFDVANMGKGPMVQWRPENGTRIGVMPRHGTADEVRWFEIDPGHVQHFWNGWVDGDRIEFSGTRFEHPDFGIDASTPLDESPVDNTPPYPARFWVDLAAGTAGWEQTDDLGGDFARFNDELDGVRSRFHYMSAVVAPERRLGDFDTIVRYDDATGERQIWNAGPTGHVGESVFAPDPQGSGRGRRLADQRRLRRRHRPHRRLRARRPRRGRRARRPGAPDPADAVRLPRQLVRAPTDRRRPPWRGVSADSPRPRLPPGSEELVALPGHLTDRAVQLLGDTGHHLVGELVGEPQAVGVDQLVVGRHPRRVQDERDALPVGALEHGDRAPGRRPGIEELDPEARRRTAPAARRSRRGRRAPRRRRRSGCRRLRSCGARRSAT